MSLPRAVRKAKRSHLAVPTAPSSQAHQRHFFEFPSVEKSASLIVGALYSAVKNILRRSLTRCKDRISRVFTPFPVFSGAHAGAERHVLKSRIIDAHRLHCSAETFRAACGPGQCASTALHRLCDTEPARGAKAATGENGTAHRGTRDAPGECGRTHAHRDERTQETGLRSRSWPDGEGAATGDLYPASGCESPAGRSGSGRIAGLSELFRMDVWR